MSSYIIISLNPGIFPWLFSVNPRCKCIRIKISTTKRLVKPISRYGQPSQCSKWGSVWKPQVRCIRPGRLGLGRKEGVSPPFWTISWNAKKTLRLEHTTVGQKLWAVGPLEFQIPWWLKPTVLLYHQDLWKLQSVFGDFLSSWQKIMDGNLGPNRVCYMCPLNLKSKKKQLDHWISPSKGLIGASY